MDELFEEKMKTVLGLIRTNNTAAEVLNITQAAYNLAQAQNTMLMTSLNTPKKTIAKKTIAKKTIASKQEEAS